MAILLGHLSYLLPAIGSGIGVFWLARWILTDEMAVIWHILLMISAFLLSLGFMWLWWSIMIPFWRIWAFRWISESSWVALKQIAIESKLIWEDDSVFERTELRTTNQKQRIQFLDQKLMKAESRQYESLRANLSDSLEYPLRLTFKFADLFGNAFVVCLAIFGFIVVPDRWILFAIMLSFPVLTFNRIIRLIKSKPGKTKLRIDQFGIHTQFPFFEIITWEDIEFINLNRSSRELEIHTDREFGSLITIKLSMYKTGNLAEFAQQIEVFMDRHLELE